MKKFKQALAIKGSKEELEALIQPLKELGYKMIENDHLCIDYWVDDLLVTDCGGNKSTLGYTKSQENRLKVPASNKDLCLALAAMVEGDIYSLGESIISKYDKNRWTTVLRLAGNNQNNHTYRKATTEEIINHFKQKDMKEKKIVGYKIIKQYPGMDKKFLGDIIQPPLYKFSDGKTMFPGACFDEKSPYYNSSFINEFLEPVYEEEKKIIKVSHSNGILEVEIRDNTAICEGKYFKKEFLESILCGFTQGWKFLPTQFDIGCKKNISREDIQKVIDALN